MEHQETSERNLRIAEDYAEQVMVLTQENEILKIQAGDAQVSHAESDKQAVVGAENNWRQVEEDYQARITELITEIEKLRIQQQRGSSTDFKGSDLIDQYSSKISQMASEIQRLKADKSSVSDPQNPGKPFLKLKN